MSEIHLVPHPSVSVVYTLSFKGYQPMSVILMALEQMESVPPSFMEDHAKLIELIKREIYVGWTATRKEPSPRVGEATQ